MSVTEIERRGVEFRKKNTLFERLNIIKDDVVVGMEAQDIIGYHFIRT